MSDAVEPQPLIAPKVTELALITRLKKLREWQDQQVEQLRSVQRQQWQQLQLEQEKVRQLLEKEKRVTSEETENQLKLEPQLSSKKDKCSDSKPECDELSENKVLSSTESDEVSEDDGVYPLSGTTSEEEQYNSQPKNECVAAHHLEDSRTIHPGISGNVKCFEDLVKEHLGHHKEMACNKDQSKTKPKQPFLKKGSGLARFNLKPKVPDTKSTTLSNKKKKCNKNAHFISVLKLKSQPNVKRLEQDKNTERHLERTVISKSEEFLSNSKGSKNVTAFEGTKIDNVVMSDLKTAEVVQNHPSDCSLDDLSFFKNEDLKKNQEKEQQELAEFEMLENEAQNSSFTSDCSLFLQTFQSPHLQSSPVGMKFCSKTRNDQLVHGTCDFQEYTESDDICNENASSVRDTDTLELRKLLEAVRLKKKILEEKVVQFQLTNESVSKGKTETLMQSNEVCSEDDTLIEEEDNDTGDKMDLQCVLQKITDKSTYQDRCQSFNESKHLSASQETTKKIVEGEGVCKLQFDDEFCWKSSLPSESIPTYRCSINNVGQNSAIKEADILIETSVKEATHSREKGIEASTDSCSGGDCGVVDRLELKQKLQELELEIQTFKNENDSLKILQKQREEALHILQKEKKEFEHFREGEMKRMEVELAEERKHLKRQKQTLERYLKMKRDLPDRKEREELTSFKHQVQQLQEELKKQELKFTSELRRLKSTLSTVEKERDRLKDEVHHLESIRLELLAALKERQAAKAPTVKFPKRAVLPISKPAVGYELPPHSVVKEAEKTEKNQNSSLILDSLNKKENDENKSEGKSLKSLKCFIDLKKKEIVESKLENTALVFVSDSLDTIETSFFSGNEENFIKNNIEDEIPKHRHRVRFNLEPQYEENSSTGIDNEFEEIHHKDRIERIYRNAEREVLYPSGTRKHFGTDSLNVTIYFYNGDVKEIFPDQRVVYHYSEAKIIQTAYPDGLEVVEFPNGQVERKHPDGTVHITFSDGTCRIIYPNGCEESQVHDGTVVKISADGTETVQYPNGETEIRTKEYKRRQYADGTVKTVYASGRQETRYANGRIRIKDKDGHVVVDTKHLVQQLQC